MTRSSGAAPGHRSKSPKGKGAMKTELTTSKELKRDTEILAVQLL